MDHLPYVPRMSVEEKVAYGKSVEYSDNSEAPEGIQLFLTHGYRGVWLQIGFEPVMESDGPNGTAGSGSKFCLVDMACLELLI